MDIGVDLSETGLPPSEQECASRRLFIELDELRTLATNNGGKSQDWKEMARWIKFEEDVLEASDRWGYPHVSSLTFHSLLEVRKTLESGVVQVGLAAQSSTLMVQIAELMVGEGQLKAEQQHFIINLLQLPHSHMGNRSLSTAASSHQENGYITTPTRNTHSGQVRHADLSEAVTLMGDDQVHHTAGDYNKELLRKIPAGTEAASVLVGTVTDLDNPVIAFVRLSHSILIDNLLEVPLPVRFVFVCLGPPSPAIDYIDIGHSAAALLSNKNFQAAAYSATDRQTLVQAMNAFLDDSMILPPAHFDKQTLVPIVYQINKKLREKKERKAKLIAQANGAPFKEEPSPADDPLRRTGRLFGGLINDVWRRYPKYRSDVTDGFNLQVLAAIIFIFFAALSPAISFGGLLSEKTNRLMGASETMLITAIGGVIFALLSGQPLLIIGATGPLMVFEESIYKFSLANGIDFLAWRFWTGLWVFVIAVVCVATEASFLVRHVTRFIQEIFACLISLIFILEVFFKLAQIFKLYPLCHSYDHCLERLGYGHLTTGTPSSDLYSNILASTSNSNTTSSWLNGSTGSNISSTSWSILGTTLTDHVTLPSGLIVMQPNTALLSMTLTFFTFILAYYFKELRNKKILGRTIRRALGDFGVPLAILLMCIMDVSIGDDVFTQKLSVPPKFSTTSPDVRDWFINPLGELSPLPVYHIFTAVVPALLASILIFMESLICGMLINKKENKIQKGTGFHLDLLLVGFLAVVSGMMGLPFICAATVRCVSHASALTVMSKNNTPGKQPKLEKIIEQRVSALAVALLVGASMFLGVVLSYIPVAVLFGVFLYMGISSLGNIQLFQRLVLMFTPQKHHPRDIGFVCNVKARKMHLYTAIQILSLAVLWGVMSSPAAIAFPFIIILLLPMRLFLFKHIFTEQELSELDKAGSCQLETTTADEPDFFEVALMPD